MTFDNEFLLLHRTFTPDGVSKTKVVLEKDLEKVVGSYWAVRVVQTAFNFQTDTISIYCRKYGRIEIFRK